MIATVAEQRAVFTGHDKEASGYLTARNFTCDKDLVYEAMKCRNKTLISNIVHHFTHKYTVDLDEDLIREHLIPAKPKEPDFPRVGYLREMTPEELAVGAYFLFSLSRRELSQRRLFFFCRRAAAQFAIYLNPFRRWEPSFRWSLKDRADGLWEIPQVHRLCVYASGSLMMVSFDC